MKGSVKTILDAVGDTPIVEMQKIGAELEASFFAKCEFLSPSGSTKDRMARALVDAAEQSGALSPGGTLVEATTGNAGAALALVAAVRGYKCICVVPEKISPEKLASLRAYGAKVIVTPTAVEPDDSRSMRSVAKQLAEDTAGAYLVDQWDNPKNPDAYADSLGPEIWAQTDGAIDAVVGTLGSGGMMMGLARFLKSQPPRSNGDKIAVVGVDASGSLYHDLAETGRLTQTSAYQLEEVGADFVPRVLDLGSLDRVVPVSDRDAFRTARDLVRLEGIFAGGSSGAAVAGALVWARENPDARNILVLLTDSANQYLSKIFNDEWMRENGFLDDEDGLGLVRDLVQLKGGADVVTAKPYDNVRQVVRKMKQHGISQLPIVDGEKLLGVVAEVDMLRYLVSGESSLDGAVKPLIEQDFRAVTPTTSIDDLKAALSEARMAVVLEGTRIVGVVTKIDLIDYLARRAS